MIIDEVHERDINTDFLLLLLRDLLAARPGIKLILMSATLDARSFSAYFGGAPLVEVPSSAPRFPVEEVYLEELASFLSEDGGGAVRGGRDARRVGRRSSRHLVVRISPLNNYE